MGTLIKKVTSDSAYLWLKTFKSGIYISGFPKRHVRVATTSKVGEGFSMMLRAHNIWSDSNFDMALQKCLEILFQTSNGFRLEKVALTTFIVCHFGPNENIFGKLIWLRLRDHFGPVGAP